MIFTRKDLHALNNLHLAWKRIQTSTRPQYKDLCRESYIAFSWHNERKIKLYSSEIEEKIYQPIHSSKFYLPKKSGLVRPITVLSVKDQIFYQAIANLICKGRLQDIKKFRRGIVFGGFNIQDPTSIYFLSFWKSEYKLYKRTIQQNFGKGYKWICKFDLASFYDTIDHNILIKIICSKIFDDDLQDIFLRSLNIWSKPQSINLPHSQGIPQGPCASQVIADLYLNYLDGKMKEISIQHDFKYLRYVDDIVLMGKKEREVKLGLIKLDIIARELALVPQSSKIEVKKVENIETEMKGENSLIDLISSIKDKTNNTRQNYLKALLEKSIKIDQNEKISIVDETSFKFSIYRINPDKNLIPLILGVAENYFYLIDLCIIYLNRLEYDKEIDDCIFHLLIKDPIHDWYTAQLLNYKYISDSFHISEIYTIGCAVIEAHDRHWFLKRMYLKILENHPDKEFIFIDKLRKSIEKEKLLESQLPYYLSLLAVCHEVDPQETQRALLESEYLKKKVFDDFYLLMGYMHHKKENHFHSKKIQNRWFTSNLLKYDGYDNFNEQDGIFYYLSSFYKVPEKYAEKVNFKELLQDDYNLALKYIYNASGFYDSNPEAYILQTDTFNQVVLSSVFRNEKNKISRYEHDSMIGKLQKAVRGSCHGLQKCHTLRANSGIVHAYNKHEKTENKKTRAWWFDEAKHLKEELSISYKYLVKYIAEKC